MTEENKKKKEVELRKAIKELENGFNRQIKKVPPSIKEVFKHTADEIVTEIKEVCLEIKTEEKLKTLMDIKKVFGVDKKLGSEEFLTREIVFVKDLRQEAINRIKYYRGKIQQLFQSGNIRKIKISENVTSAEEDIKSYESKIEELKDFANITKEYLK